jgi:hypothetical protein
MCHVYNFYFFFLDRTGGFFGLPVPGKKKEGGDNVKEGIPKDLLEAVYEAVEEASRRGIRAWGLKNSVPEYFRDTKISEPTGCTSDTCLHYTHDPAAPTIMLTPLRGRLVYLGTENYENYDITFYALILSDKTVYFKVIEPEHYWAEIQEVPRAEVPKYMLARLRWRK